MLAIDCTPRLLNLAFKLWVLSRGVIMRQRFRGHRLLAVVSLWIAAFALSSRCDAANIISYTSSPTSWVGHGETRTVTSDDGAIFFAKRYFEYANYTNSLWFQVDTQSEDWGFNFVGPNATLPVVGFYPNAQRWPFESPGHPGLAFSANSRGDNTLTGEFTVLQAAYDENGNISSFAADFVQYDEGQLA